MAIVICSILLCSDMSLFEVWGTKINSKALGYMKYPKELMPTVFTIQNTNLFLVILFQIVVASWLYHKFIKIETQKIHPIWLRIIFAILLPLLLIIGFRGGIQRVPINRNWVFFSNASVLNYGALNSFWNTANLLTHPIEKQENPYSFYQQEEAIRFTEEMHRPLNDSNVLFVNTNRPNIVIIFLESWAADVMECLGGESDVTPLFGKLAEDGILFTNFYSTGYRTEQGFLATLSATPALPVGSIIQTFGKFEKLPNLYRTFNGLGYQTSFYSGGRLFFDNIEAYLRSAGVQVMKGENEWEIKKRTVWGAYDEEIFDLHIREMNATKEPFFSALTTMTTHEWFDADVPKVFKNDPDKVNDGYRNTMHYADSCLYAYMQESKKQPWYKNTIFLIVADHACKFPKGRSNYEAKRHHIPMLVTGGAIDEKWRGTRNQTIGSHTDIAATLLTQLQIKSSDFSFSKDLFNPGFSRFAYYAFDNGFGMITKDGHVIYDHNRQMITEIHGNDSAKLIDIANKGKAYLQVQFQNNLDVVSKKK